MVMWVSCLPSHPFLFGRGKNEILDQFLSTETHRALPLTSVGVTAALVSELLITYVDYGKHCTVFPWK